MIWPFLGGSQLTELGSVEGGVPSPDPELLLGRTMTCGHSFLPASLGWSRVGGVRLWHLS